MRAVVGRVRVRHSYPQKRFGIACDIQGCKSPPMPTPMFTVRLSQKTQADLREFAKVYGSPNASAFAREVLEVMCSGDLSRVKDFNARLIARAGEQMTLNINGAIEASVGEAEKVAKKALKHARKPAKKGRKPSKTGKGVRRAS